MFQKNPCLISCNDICALIGQGICVTCCHWVRNGWQKIMKIRIFLEHPVSSTKHCHNFIEYVCPKVYSFYRQKLLNVDWKSFAKIGNVLCSFLLREKWMKQSIHISEWQYFLYNLHPVKASILHIHIKSYKTITCLNSVEPGVCTAIRTLLGNFSNDHLRMKKPKP